MRELNRLGITSAIDAGGGFQNYPDDYAIIEELHRRGEMTVRIAYNLFTQKPKGELDDFAKWVGMTKPGDGERLLPDERRRRDAGLLGRRLRGLPGAAARPAPGMEGELNRVVRLLAENRWPFRLHATYDESITRFLDVFEAVNREVPFDGLRWFFDHAETITERNLERVKALGGGIAVQHRMAFQGEYFVDRYGAEAAGQTPPVAKMLAMGIPVGAGTDATRVASYNPWVSLYWLVTGQDRRRPRPLPRGEPARPGDGAAPLHPGHRLVLRRGGRQGRARRRPARRPGRPLGRLLRGAGGGDPGDRVGADRGRRQGRLRGGAVRPACAPALSRSCPTGRRSRPTEGMTRASLRRAPGTTRSLQCAHRSGLRGLLHRPLLPTHPAGSDPFWGPGCACWAF